ncbi:MAG: AAA family ATPase [Crocinitomicaceae bacterium]
MYYKISGHKGIIDETKIDIAPITILIGKNGSGKSSTISALKEFKEFFNWERSLNNNNFTSRLSFKTIKSSDNTNKISKYTAPIKMIGFDGEFEIILSMAKHNDMRGLVAIEVFNIKTKKTLLEFKLIDSNKESFVSKIKIHIDYNYIKNQILKIIEQKNKESDIFKNLTVGRISEKQQKEILDEETKLRSNHFNKLLDSGFYETETRIENDHLPEGNFNLNIDYEPLQNLKKDSNYFKLTQDNKPYYNDDFLKNLSESFEKNDLFINYFNSTHFPFDFFISELLNHKSSILLHSDIIESLGLNDNEDFNDLRKLLNFNVELNEPFAKVLDNLLFDNLHLGLVNLYSEMKFNHIPPNRINYTKKNSESPIDFVFNYTRILKAAGFDLSSSTFFIDYWFKEFNIDFGLAYNDIDSVLNYLASPRDFEKHGYGIQQLVPLIIIFSLSDSLHKKDFNDTFAHYNSPTKKIFLVEEPEANLHPNFQSKLADILLDSFWKYNNQYIIETHSEYLLRKLQLNVAKNKLDPSIINIYYFDNPGQNPRKINLNDDGSLSENLGPGFLDESNNLATDLLISRLNKN